MHHGRSAKAISKQLGDLLLVASITKTLSESGTRNLAFDPAHSVELTEPILLKILSNPSLHSSKKLDFFNWCRSLSPHYKHSATAYSRIFYTVCRAGYLNEVPALLHSMKEDGVVVDSQAFKVLLDAFIISGKFDFALEILDYMEELGTSLSPNMYNYVLIALVRKNQVGLAKMGRADLASAVLDRLLERGGYLDIVMYNTLINALGKAGRIDVANKFFEHMRTRGINPDVVTYNTLIEVHNKAGRLKDG